MKTRPTQWFDTEAMCQRYGFKVLHNGQWLDAADNGEVLLFDTPEERDARRAAINAQEQPNERD